MKINQNVKQQKKNKYFMLNTTNERYFVFGVFSCKNKYLESNSSSENNKWSHKKIALISKVINNKMPKINVVVILFHFKFSRENWWLALIMTCIRKYKFDLRIRI